MAEQDGKPADYWSAASDFWISESLKVLAVGIDNARFYMRDPGKADQVAELLEVIAGIPPCVRHRPLSDEAINRVSYFVERANQIMREVEQGIGRTPTKPTFRARIARLLALGTGSRREAEGMHRGGTEVALRMQNVVDRRGKGIMAPGLMKAGE